MAEEQPKEAVQPVPQRESVLDRSQVIVERLEAANAKREELLNREEKLEAFKRLGGMSEAGTPPPTPREETPQEYAKRILHNDLREGEGRY